MASVPQSTLAQDVGPPLPPAPATRPANPPASQPASQPTTDTVLRYSPLRTLVWHAMAMAAGQPDVVRDCYFATGPDEKAIVDGYVHLATSIGKLRKAATDRFGETGFDAIGFGPMFADEIKRLEKSRFTLSAERAIVQPGGASASPMILVWKNNNWKISVADTYTRNPKRRAARIDAQASAYEDLATDIAAGKYKLALEARQAGTEKVATAMKAAEAELSKGGTTQPTTKP